MKNSEEARNAALGTDGRAFDTNLAQDESPRSLETTKEEVQSTNEELTTVHDELRHRNRELAKASAPAPTPID
jgi:hypothetical protein